MTVRPENIRFHAAGHLAAVHALVLAGHVGAAKHILEIVRQYADSPRVESPPQLKEKIDLALSDPKKHVADIALLERWFCDPFNTTIEESGARS